MKTIQKVVFVISILLLAVNSYAGRWLTRDPIAFMERDPKPTMVAQQANLYTFVDNNPINEVDPLGLWGIAFGNNSGSHYVNVGWGNPNLYFSPSSANDAGQGAAAFTDGINPFGNPFANNGFYDPCNGALKGSKAIGSFTGITLLTLATDGLGDELLGADEATLLKPPGWNSDWELMGSTRAEGKAWYDTEGGEWRLHEADPWHPETHWDYNPNTAWNSSGVNVPLK